MRIAQPITHTVVRPLTDPLGQSLDARIRALFANGEQGAWYDPSDLSTLFQDSAGTTPVTAVEQPVGLILDKSQGLVLGSELVANGTFDTDTTGWIAGNIASLSVVGQKLRVQHDGTNYPLAAYNISTVAGKTYRIHFSVTRGTSPNGIGLRALNLSFGGGGAQLSDSGYKTASGDYVCVFKAVSSTSHIYFIVNTETVGTYDDVDNVSIRELSGNHASQPAAASRPVLSARKNLALNSEQIDAANWVKRGAAAVTANAVAAPDGTLTGDLISGLAASPTDDMYYNITIGTVGTSYVPSVHIKRVSTSGVVLLQNPYTGPAGGEWRINMALLSDAWERIVPGHAALTIVTPFVAGSPIEGGGFQFGALSGGPLSFHLWGAQVETGTVATRYQRVSTDADYDTVGFPNYWRLDGVDDSAATAAGGGATTSAVIVMGFRTAAIGAAQTLFSDRSGNTGLKLEITAGGNIAFSGGNGASINTATGAAVAENTDYVVTAKYDGTNLSVQLNRDTATTTACALSAGTAAITLGKDNGAATGFHNGRCYGTVYVKNTAKSAGEIASAEAYMAAKMGVTL